MLGGARSTTRTRAPSGAPSGSHLTPPAYLLHASAFRIFQREFEFARKRLHRCSAALPGAFGLEPQIADTPAPRRDDASNRTVIAAVRVVLIEAANDVRRDPDE